MTIVVLIILAVVSINVVLGEQGIIRQAESSRAHQANGVASDNEKIEQWDAEIANALAGGSGGNDGAEGSGGSDETDDGTGGSGGQGGSGGEGGSGGTNPTAGTSATKPETWTNTAVTAIADGEGGVVPLPDNFYYVGGTKNTGLVISDKANDTMTPTAESAGNQFVWVPVSDTAFGNMFETGTVALSGTKSDTTTYGENGISSNYYSKLRQRSNDYYSIATVTEGAYSSTSAIREPDLVTDYDKTEEYYTDAGYSSAKAMAEGFVTDYTNMRASIERYKGFYIGRYELTGTTSSPTVKPGAVLDAGSSEAGNWYGLYKACRDVGTGKNNVTTTMIWGCQWDETMNWLRTCGYNTDTDSSSWGNYSDYNTTNEYTEEDFSIHIDK